MAKIVNQARSMFVTFSELETGGIFEFKENYYIKAEDDLYGGTYGVNLYSGIEREFSSTEKIIPRYDTEIIIK